MAFREFSHTKKMCIAGALFFTLACLIELVFYFSFGKSLLSDLQVLLPINLIFAIAYGWIMAKLFKPKNNE